MTDVEVSDDSGDGWVMSLRC